MAGAALWGGFARILPSFWVEGGGSPAIQGNKQLKGGIVDIFPADSQAFDLGFGRGSAMGWIRKEFYSTFGAGAAEQRDSTLRTLEGDCLGRILKDFEL